MVIVGVKKRDSGEQADDSFERNEKLVGHYLCFVWNMHVQMFRHILRVQ